MEKTKATLSEITLLSLKGSALNVVPLVNRPDSFMFYSVSAMLTFLKDNFTYLYENEHEITVLEGAFTGQKITLEDLFRAKYLVKLWNKDKSNGKYRF
jgi:hypothetical protein